MFGKIEDALRRLQRGDFIVLVDDENRENEGDLVIAAEKATPSKLNYMIKWARGIMCIPMEGTQLDRLGIPLMVPDSTDRFNTRFTVSVDARNNTTTGVSVYDRMETIRILIGRDSKPEQLAMPGHMFPLRASENGVLERPGHTEAAVDLCRLAGLFPAAIIVEIMKNNGEMAKLDELRSFSDKHKLSLYAIKDLVSYRKKNNV